MCKQLAVPDPLFPFLSNSVLDIEHWCFYADAADSAFTFLTLKKKSPLGCFMQNSMSYFKAKKKKTF